MKGIDFSGSEISDKVAVENIMFTLFYMCDEFRDGKQENSLLAQYVLRHGYIYIAHLPRKFSYK